VALWDAGYAAKNRAERTAQDIRRFALREMYRFLGSKRESERL
jgi:hypothetical protein